MGSGDQCSREGWTKSTGGFESQDEVLEKFLSWSSKFCFLVGRSGEGIYQMATQAALPSGVTSLYQEPLLATQLCSVQAR